ncbi:MAG TPA: HgcAB-associated protein [Methanocella sp.]|uniref:HgcAB-associated protein HgcC n=1 Tax=Methanocella sp. TaxID=2052833 RepID=UPI002CBFCFE5|nr:HgcAB-associated protein [Methanocella sp.]HTY91190.1 HgcAB-associated protein [Methanocella sp.]
MGRKSKKDLEALCCSGTASVDDGDSRVEAVISVDERGQMVLPKEVREKVGIKAGDKLVVISRKDGDTICCISLIKTDYFMRVLSDKLGPVMNELLFKK